MAHRTVDQTMRWARLGGLGVVLVLGWLFIAWQNEFHITPPLVFVCLGFLAVVLTTYNLWRTGAAAVAPNEEDDGDASWGKPAGVHSELDREKRTLLKAIKEAEFDHAMGKLSKADVDQMIGMYRARAIDVIKEIEQLELGAAGSVRERILREVKARAAVAGKIGKDGKADTATLDDVVEAAKPADEVVAKPVAAAAEEVAAKPAEEVAAEPAEEVVAKPAAAEEVAAATETAPAVAVPAVEPVQAATAKEASS
jgi:hypothetical protein